MAGRRGAPEIVLIESERSELEGLARRRKTAQALAMRARIVLACAEGLQSKQVAARLGWIRPPSASGATVSRREAGWAPGRAALGRAANDRRRAHRGGDRHDAREPARGRHPLELARHGQGLRAFDLDGPAHLAGLRPAAPPAGDLQALHRSRFRRQGARRRRALHVASGSRHRPVRGREITNPGARPQPADVADAPGPAGAPEP